MPAWGTYRIEKRGPVGNRFEEIRRSWRVAAAALALTGFASAERLVAAAHRGEREVPASPPWGFEQLLLDAGPQNLGALLVAFDRWVVEAFAGVAVALFRVAVWVAARSDVDVLARPGDVVATRALRWRRAIEPAVGGSLAWIAWAALGLAALAALTHALWKGG